MPFAWVDAEEIIRLNEQLAAHYVYKNDFLDGCTREYLFVLDPHHGEEQAYDIRDFAGFDDAKTLAANIKAAYAADTIKLDDDGAPYATWAKD